MTPRRRIEGVEKVTGSLLYVDDVTSERLGHPCLHAVAVRSSVACARIASIDDTRALAVPGVRTVVTHRNAPRLRKVTAITMAEVGQRLPLQDDHVTYHGECLAVVVADTLIAAREAAALVAVTYDEVSQPMSTLAVGQSRLKPVKCAGMAPGRVARADADAEYARSSCRLEATYFTAPYHHNAIEPSSVIARWDDDGGVTVHAAVQWHHVDTLAIGQAFGLGASDGVAGFARRKLLGHAFAGKVRLVNHPAGGAFGRNLTTVPLFLACMAARVAGDAVKLTLGIEDTYSLLSHRGEVTQRIRLGASDDGTLNALIVEADVAVGAAGKYVEPVGSWSCQVYDQRAHRLQHRVARLDRSGVGWMRAPGGASAMFALESAVDELADRLGIDPLEVRLRNHAERDPESGKPWTSKALRECYRRGADAIGWYGRPAGGTVVEGRLIGHGMATAYEASFRFPASVSITIGRDATAIIELTVSEMGQGLWTGLHTLAAEALGFEPGRVILRTDTTDLPAGAGAIASTGAYSNGHSILTAARAVRSKLFELAAHDSRSDLYRCATASMTLADSIIWGPEGRRQSVADLLERHPTGTVSAAATTGRDFGRSDTKKATFGAVFVRVAVDPQLGHIDVQRVVGVYDCGQIIEPTIVRSQLVGGIIWGIGHALMEESHVDDRTGRWTNGDLGEALIPTAADIPDIEVMTVDYPRGPDDPFHLKGASEIGVIGVAPAIANAVFDATRQRLRTLPMRIEHRIAQPSRPS